MTQELTPSAQALATQAARLLADARELSITTTDQYSNAGALLQSVKGLARRLESERLAQTRPLEEQKKAVLDLYRPLNDVLIQAEGVIKRAIIAFQDEERRRSREEQQRRDEAARREQARLEERARAAREKADADAAALREAGRDEVAEAVEQSGYAKADRLADRADVVTAPIAPVSIPKVAGISTRQVWKFAIEDARLLPREYLIPDMTKLGGYVRAMKQDAKIPGVRVWSEDNIAAGAKE